MPNLTALIGLVVGLVALFVEASLGVKLIAVYLILAGVLRLLAAENANALPQAPRRAVAAPVKRNPDDSDGLETSINPADAYRTFTPEDLAKPKKGVKSRRPTVDESAEDEDGEEE